MNAFIVSTCFAVISSDISDNKLECTIMIKSYNTAIKLNKFFGYQILNCSLQSLERRGVCAKLISCLFCARVYPMAEGSSADEWLFNAFWWCSLERAESARVCSFISRSFPGPMGGRVYRRGENVVKYMKGTVRKRLGVVQTWKVHYVEFWRYLLAEMEYKVHNILMEFMSCFMFHSCIIITCNYESMCFHELGVSPLYLYGERVQPCRAALVRCYSQPEQTNL